MDVFALSLFFVFIFFLRLFIRNRKEKNAAINALRAINEWGRVLNEFYRSPLLALAFKGSFEGVYDERLNNQEMMDMLDNLLKSYNKLAKHDPQNPYVQDEKILEVILAPITKLFICPCWCIDLYGEGEAVFHCRWKDNKFGKCCVKCDKCGKLVNALVYDLHNFLCEKLRLERIRRKINPR